VAGDMPQKPLVLVLVWRRSVVVAFVTEDSLKLFKESRNVWGKRALCARKLVPLHPQIAKITFLIN
jgi:hypothetical protein